MLFKTLLKRKGFAVCFFFTLFWLVVGLTLVFVLTFDGFLYQTLNSTFGGERRVIVSGDPSEYVRYNSDYSSKAAAYNAANKLNQDIFSEGAVLMKNNNVLPLKRGDKITVFGKNSVNLVLGGSGSSAGPTALSDTKSIYDALSAVNLGYNAEMKKFYENDSRSGEKRVGEISMGTILTGLPIGETSAEKYYSVRDTYPGYPDAAIVVISRIGGEGFDLPRTMFWDGKGYNNFGGTQVIPGAASRDSHYLQLDNNELAMIKEAESNFKKVIVIINSASAIEAAGLKSDDGVDAIIWIGNPGAAGIMALGRILVGDISPSGRLPDTYAHDFKKDPVWKNFGNNLTDKGNRYYIAGKARNAYYVEYKEGIYMGYRYYETRGHTERQAAERANPAGAEAEKEAWYDENVVYPFGYGLSYTKFDWEEVTEGASKEGERLTRDGEVTSKVKITNTGKVAGKEVVQMYYTAPYTPGGIEKPYVVLGDFRKTRLLEPGDSEVVSITIKARRMSSYDYSDANRNGFKGYELEKGLYTVRLSMNAHEHVINKTVEVVEGFRYEEDEVTKTKIENRFDNVSGHIARYMSREDFAGTFPAAPGNADSELAEADALKMAYTVSDKKSDPWYSETAPAQPAKQMTYKQAGVKLYHLIGKEYEDSLWDDLLAQITAGQMAGIINNGAYKTNNINNVDKPLTIEADGPMGFAIFMGDPSVYGVCYYVSECVMAATFNKELAERYGEMIGNESCLGDMAGDGRTYSGWYAPAVNLHRSPFSGRNFEYYSEDSRLSAEMAQRVITGAKKKGVYTYVKHFALNDQETNRDTNGLVTWASEQAMREMYFVPFEDSVKEGKTTAVMSSLNRIGLTWAGGSYELITGILRNEWGFKGTVITDYNVSAYMNVDQMIRAGGDLNLSYTTKLADTTSATARTCMRSAVKNIFYTVSQSNAMNGLGENVKIRYARPYWWIIMMTTVFAVSGMLLAACAITFLNISGRQRGKNDNIKT